MNNANSAEIVDEQDNNFADMSTPVGKILGEQYKNEYLAHILYAFINHADLFRLFILDKNNETPLLLNSSNSLTARSTLIKSYNTEPNAMNQANEIETVHKMQVDGIEKLVENKNIQSLGQFHMDCPSTPLSTSDGNTDMVTATATEIVSNIQVKCEASPPQDRIDEWDHSAIGLDSDDDCILIEDELIELGVVSNANNEHDSNNILPLVNSRSYDLVKVQPCESRKDKLQSKRAVKDCAGLIFTSNESLQQGNTYNKLTLNSKLNQNEKYDR